MMTLKNSGGAGNLNSLLSISEPGTGKSLSSEQRRKYRRRIVWIAAAMAGVAGINQRHAHAQTLTWDPLNNGTSASDGSGTWNAGSGTNFTNGTTDQTWANGNAAVFGAGGSGTYNVTVGTPITLTGMTVNAGATAYNFSGSLLNTFAIGGGTINYSSNVTMASFNLSGTGNITFNGSSNSTLTLTGSGSYQDSFTGAINVSGGILNVNYGGVSGFTTPFNYHTTNTPGQLFLVGPNATLIEGQANSIGSAYNPASVNVSGGTFTMNGGSYGPVVNLTGATFNTTNGSVYNQYYNEGNGQGITTFASATTSLIAVPLGSGYSTTPFTIALGTTSGFDAIYTGVTSGSYGISKSGPGALELTGISTDSGTTSVTDGTLTVAAGATIGSNSASLVVSSNTSNASPATTVNLFNSITISSLSGTLTGTGASAIINLAGNLTDTQTSTTTYAGNINASGGLILSSSGSLTLPGNVNFSGGLTLSSIGSLTLTGTSAFSGALTLNGGTLLFGTSGTSVPGVTFTALNLTGGAALISGYVVNGNTLALGSITRGSYSTVDITLPNSGGTVTTTTPNSTNGILGGWATVNGGASWAVSAATGGAPGVISGFSPTSATYSSNYASATATSDFNAGSSGSFTYSSVNSLQFNTASAVTAVLPPTGFTVLSGGILNSPAVGANLSNISGGTLTSGLSGELIVNQYNTGAALQILSNIVNNGSTPLALTKSGGGVLKLSGANTYSGGTYLQAGGIALGSVAGLGSGSLIVGPNAYSATAASSTNSPFLDLSGLTLVSPVLSSIIPNNIVLPAAATTTYYTIVIPSGPSSPQTLSGVISGGSSTTNIELNTTTSGDAAGTYILTGTNTFVGNVFLNRGSLSINSDAALGGDSNVLTISTNVGTTFQFQNSMTFGHPITDNQTTFFDTQANSVTISSLITGTGTYTKIGAGTLSLTAANNAYTGTFILDNGTLSLGTNGTFNSSSATSAIQLSGGTLATVSGHTVSQVFGSTLLIGGESTISTGNFSATTLNLSLGAITRSTGTGLSFATIPTTGKVTTKTANTATTILGGWATAGGNTWAVSAGNGTTAGAVTGLATYGSTYSTATTTTDFDALTSDTFASSGINSLRYNTASALTSTLNGAFVIASGGILETAAVGSNAVTITGGTSLTSGNGTDLIVTQNNTASPLTISTPIANNGSTNIGLTVEGPGTVVLGSANTYNGSTYVIGGATLNVNSDSNFGTIPAAVTAGAIVLNGGTITSSSTFAFNASRGMTIGNNGGIFNIASGSTVTYGGVIANGTNPGTLIKTGAGTLALTGTSTFTGGTIVNAGILALSGGYASGTLRGSLTINSGATVNVSGFTDLGQGSSAVNPVIINAGGVFNGSGGQPVSYSSNFILNGGSIIGSNGILFSPGYGITTQASTTTATIATSVSGYGTVPLYFNVSSGSTATGIDLNVSGGVYSYSGTTTIVKYGTGTLQLAGANTNGGGTIINAGKIYLTGSLTGPTVINSGGTLSVLGFEDTPGSTVTVNAGGVYNTATAPSGQTQPTAHATNFNLNGGSITGTYGIILNAGYGISTLGGATTSTIAGSVYGYGTVPLFFNVSSGTTASGIDLLVSGTIASYNGTTTLIKNGTGVMEITGTGAPAFNGAFYNGGAFVNAGELIVASANTAFNTSVVPGGINVANGAILDFTGSDLTNVNNSINLSGGSLFALSNASNPAYNGNTYYVGSVNFDSTDGLPAVANTSDGSYLRFGYNANGLITSIGPVANSDSQGIILVNGSSHVMTVTTGPGNTLTLSGNIVDLPTLIGTPINFNGSGTTILTGSNTYSGPTTVSNGTLIIGVHGALPTNNSVLINTGATLVSDSQSTISSTRVLNVDGNVIVHNGSLSTLSASAQTAFNNGWAGASGIISSAASSDNTHLTALGVIQNSLNQTTTGTALYNTFEGQSVSNTDVLIKYTYYGDANLDGKVDGSDYSLIDNSYEMEGWTSTGPTTMISGWYNGDFNYDGVVDGSDYTLIDNAFNSQGTQISAEIASPTAEIAPSIGGGGVSAVPEPTSLGLLGLSAIGLLGRRRRRI